MLSIVSTLVTLFESMGSPLRSGPRPPLRGVREGVRAPLPDGDGCASPARRSGYKVTCLSWQR